MWKREESAPAPELPETLAPSREPGPASAPPAPRARASIGRSIAIRGEVTGEEDLVIEGRVDGAVDLKQHSVTVGSGGLVKAGITGRMVTVEGTVQGDIRAEEVVVLRSTAVVQGDITTPRLVLEDGASFRGAVDMGDKPEARVPVGSAPRVDRVGSAADGKPADAKPADAKPADAKPAASAPPNQGGKGGGSAALAGT
ncbi:MAG: bactofilin family protein [Longimicrobiales bacterium]